jgi:hypothetical protein
MVPDVEYYHHADCEDETEDSRSETRLVEVKLFAHPQPEALNDDKHQSRPDGHRWEQEAQRGSQAN